MKARPAPARKPIPAAAAPTEAQSLEKAADLLFGTPDNPLVLRGGRKIVVQKGQVRNVGLLLGFFNALLQNMSRDDVVTLVKLIEENTAKAAGTYQLPGIDELVTKAFDASSLVVAVFNATYQTLPKIAATLTELTEEEFLSLDMDEGAMVAFAIFEVNYRFFSQSLPLAMKAFLVGASKKLAEKAI